MPSFTAEGAGNGLEFSIVRPFDWIGPRMDSIPGIEGPSESVPWVLHALAMPVYFLIYTSVKLNLLCKESLKLVDSGQS
ncbi:putative dihydroflavonol reductase [Sesbania bispinosa]|nr:putative dihydroflavonol reductase [Sesbania bispinosa]